MKPTEFTVRQLREASDTPPTIAFDCAVWLANRGHRCAKEDCVVERSNLNILEYLRSKS